MIFLALKAPYKYEPTSERKVLNKLKTLKVIFYEIIYWMLTFDGLCLNVSLQG